ncbi:gliding motility-associated C-terminal domain-containing protein [Hydrotalea sp.]|uniref:gliding motility-associated C-terminal domain-containing protein n=1 Tax=Hydrotalea sp. TaxID=2881279 RepID=UPI0025897C97|nr:gliding motility-associated C-terminal domain-containing protein [Hydrotalea sp.]
MPIKQIVYFIFFTLLAGGLHAQLCSGSLGDPVINITFGSGNNPGTALPFGVTNYIYVPNDCPKDGYYTIANATNGCFGNTWFRLTEDHTSNDVNGYMMLINASYDPGDFYVDTVKGLCGSTTYEFASWVLNLNTGIACNGNPILANVTFSIETTTGTVLQQYSTGDIPTSITPLWRQYGFYFSTPNNTSNVVIRMRNNAPGGCGNDLALDDITFRPCGPLITVTNNGQTTNTNICDTDKRNILLNSTVSSGFNNTQYQWQTYVNGNWQDIAGANNNNYVRLPTPAGNYQYRVVVAQGNNIQLPACRVASNAYAIGVEPKPSISIQTNNAACLGDKLQVSASSAGNQFLWSGPSGFQTTQPSFSIFPLTNQNEGYYYVNTTTALGCTNTDSVFVSVSPIPLANAGSSQTVCAGSSVVLRGSGGEKYKWVPAANLSSDTIPQPTATPADSTMYYLTVSNGNCNRTDSVMVNILHLPVAAAGKSFTIFEGDQVQLNGSAAGDDIQYFWTPDYNISNTNILDPVVYPIKDTTYTLHVVSQQGCGEAVSKTFIRVYNKISVPNAFSPNGDGINDFWEIKDLYTYPTADVSVFDRNGQMIFHTIGYGKPWDGTYNDKPVPIGTYYYIINLNNGTPLRSGSVLIIR